jgi:hypothetical protein
MCDVKCRLKSLGLLLSSALSLVLSATAQVSVGDNLKFNLSGDLSTGYSGGFRETGISDHSMDFGGDGRLHGYYYNPQFFSFDLQPYYNRSQANSDYRSITDSSGFIGSANLFTGSRFPGSISFTKSYDNSGQFGIPGVSGLSTANSGDMFVANWSVVVPNLPSLDINYSLGTQNTTVYGVSGTTRAATGNLGLHSDYKIAGFSLSGVYAHQSMDMDYPGFLSAGFVENSSTGQSRANSLGFSAAHAIPFGYWSTSCSLTNSASNSNSTGFRGLTNGTAEAINTTVSLQPIRNLGFSVGATYQDNVLAALQEQIIAAGGFTPLRTSDLATQALSLNANANYQVSKYIRLNAQAIHHEEYFSKSSIGITQFRGGVSTTYARNLFGSLSFSVGATDTATQEGNAGAGMYGNVNYSRRVLGWETGADFNYSQDVQTLGGVYTTSNYGYGASAKRKFSDRFYWSNSFHQAHSGLTQQAGTSSHSESMSSSVLFRRYTGTLVYSQSVGTSILTSHGLVAVPTGIPTTLVAAPVLYNARSLGGGLSTTIKRISVTANYSRSLSETTSSTFSSNSTTMWNGLLRCRMRQLYLNAGFTRFQQSVGAAGTLPSVVNSYYFGVSRWFNVF